MNTLIYQAIIEHNGTTYTTKEFTNKTEFYQYIYSLPDSKIIDILIGVIDLSNN
jgi:hypothetical protein